MGGESGDSAGGGVHRVGRPRRRLAPPGGAGNDRWVRALDVSARTWSRPRGKRWWR